MKFGNVPRLIAALIAAAILSGCSFTGMRRVPTDVPKYTMKEGCLSGVYRNLPVSVDAMKCTDSAAVCKRGFFGGTSPSGIIPVRSVIGNEFEEMVKQVFRAPVGGEREKMTIVVSTRSVVVTRRGSSYTCELILEVALVDPIAQDRRPYFASKFKSKMTSRERNNDSIPHCVYAAIHDVMDQLLEELRKNRYVTRRLDELVVNPTDVKEPPKLERISCAKRADGRVGGTCDVLCNDWDALDADRWARSMIRESCAGRLGVPPERVRVVFNSTYDEVERRWNYTFDGKARVGLSLNYDPMTKSGVCTADLGLLEMTAAEASESMKKYVLSEMKLRRGAISSEGESGEVLVRFDELTTDEAANQLKIAFRLIK